MESASPLLDKKFRYKNTVTQDRRRNPAAIRGMNQWVVESRKVSQKRGALSTTKFEIRN
jgi:hypothetical protein